MIYIYMISQFSGSLNFIGVFQGCLYVSHCQDPGFDTQRRSWQSEGGSMANILWCYQSGTSRYKSRGWRVFQMIYLTCDNNFIFYFLAA